MRWLNTVIRSGCPGSAGLGFALAMHWAHCNSLANSCARWEAPPCFNNLTKCWLPGWPMLICSFCKLSWILASFPSLSSLTLAATKHSVGWWHATDSTASLRRLGTLSMTAGTNLAVYCPTYLLTLPTSGWLPATGWWTWCFGSFFPGHLRPKPFMLAWDTNNRLDLRMGSPWGTLRPNRHMSHSIKCILRIKCSTRGNFQIDDGFGCSSSALPPAFSWVSISSQQKLMNNMVRTRRLSTSEGSMYSWFRWNQPPAQVHGGLQTNKSGGLLATISRMDFRWSALLKSQPVNRSADRPVWPRTAVCWANRGGENTSMTLYWRVHPTSWHAGQVDWLASATIGSSVPHQNLLYLAAVIVQDGWKTLSLLTSICLSGRLHGHVHRTALSTHLEAHACQNDLPNANVLHARRIGRQDRLDNGYCMV